MKINFKALSEKEIQKFMQSCGQSSFRSRQVIEWIYAKYASSFSEMTNLPKPLRELLDKKAFISNLKLINKQTSKDGVQKFLFGLKDGKKIESVLIPDKKRLTLCVSSQVGCAMGCKLCETGRLGLKRNLKAYEIFDQIISVQRLIDNDGILNSPDACKISNIVFMGMGEPLNNYSEVIRAVRVIVDMLGFSRRRVTVSTAGIVPGIDKLAREDPQVNLAVSLNAVTDSVRSRIMPVNKKYPIRDLLNACRKYPLPPRRRITFEYVLLGEINDSGRDALQLIKLLKGIKAKVNLIPYNRSSSAKGPAFKEPQDKKIAEFKNILCEGGITAIIRKSRGGDISAACGQLAASYISRNSDTIFKSSGV